MNGLLFHLINLLSLTVGIGLRRAAGSSGGAAKSTCLKQGEIVNDESPGFC